MKYRKDSAIYHKDKHNSSSNFTDYSCSWMFPQRTIHANSECLETFIYPTQRWELKCNRYGSNHVDAGVVGNEFGVESPGATIQPVQLFLRSVCTLVQNNYITTSTVSCKFPNDWQYMMGSEIVHMLPRGMSVIRRPGRE